MARSKVLRIALAVLALTLIGITAVVLSSPTREPSFIARLHGRIVSPQSPFPSLAGMGIKSDSYQFETTYDELSKAMHRELTAQGWEAAQPKLQTGGQGMPFGWSFSKGDEQFVILPDGEGPVIVNYYYKPSWLESQIAAVRGWFR